MVHNGIKLDRCIKSRNEWRDELNIDQDAVVATMLANFRPQKDHQTLLYAWHKMLKTISPNEKRPRLLLAGAHQQSFDTAYQLARNLSLLDSVSFLEQIQDVADFLAASDIGVLISPKEGMSNSILEYMASGLPIIATDNKGNREAIGKDYPIQFCKPNDIDDLATHLQIFIENYDLRQRIGKMNKKRTEKDFSLNTMLEKIVAIIADPLNKDISKAQMPN